MGKLPRKKVRHCDEPGSTHFRIFSCSQRLAPLRRPRMAAPAGRTQCTACPHAASGKGRVLGSGRAETRLGMRASSGTPVLPSVTLARAPARFRSWFWGWLTGRIGAIGAEIPEPIHKPHEPPVLGLAGVSFNHLHNGLAALVTQIAAQSTTPLSHQLSAFGPEDWLRNRIHNTLRIKTGRSRTGRRLKHTGSP